MKKCVLWLILKALDWSDTDWFYSTYERKPEALTSDIWKLEQDYMLENKIVKMNF